MDCYIEDKRVVLSDNEKIAVTFQVNDLGELKNRQANFTNENIAKVCAENKEIFGDCEVMQSLTNIPYKKNKAKIVEGGQEITNEGFAIVEKTDKDGYHFTVYSGNATFFELIKDKKLKDLDVAFLNHCWSQTIQIASRTNTAGYIYAICNWENNLTYYDVELERLYFSIFTHTLVHEIVTQAGWKEVGPFFVAPPPKYMQHLIPFSNKTLLHDDSLASLQTFSAWKFGTQTLTKFAANTQSGLLIIQYENDFSGAPHGFDNGGYSCGGIGGLGNNYEGGQIFPATSIYNVPGAGKYRFTAQAFIQINGANQPCTTEMYIMKNNSVLGIVNAIIGQTSFTANPGSAANMFVDTGVVQMDDDDKVTVRMRLFAGVAGSDNFINILGGTQFDYHFKCIEVLPPIKAKFSKFLEVAPNLPDITQGEFLRGIAEQYGIFFQSDELKKELKFFQFKDIVNNIAKAKTLDNTKHVNQDEDEIEVHNTNYGQNNFMKYKEDDNVLTSYGDGSFAIADETLELTKEVFTLPFAASHTDKPFVPQIPIANLTHLQGSRQPRCVYLKMYPAVALNYKYRDGLGVTQTIVVTNVPATYFIFPGEIYNLGFNDSLIKDNYSELVFSLQQFKKLGARILWYDNELGANLDFEIPYYVTKHSAYFYLNQIKDYIQNSPKGTKTILIRLT